LLSHHRFILRARGAFVTVTSRATASQKLLATEDELGTWLNLSVEEALALVKPFLPEQIWIVQAMYKRFRFEVHR
jgi:hypothetical protein